jgi:hypothetical protein
VSMTNQQDIRLSPTELLACWTALDLGEPPTSLWLRPPGTTTEETQRLLAQAIAELAQRGLSDGVQPHPQLAGMLRTIANPDHRVDIRFQDLRGNAPPTLGLGALAGAHSVIIATTDGGGDAGLTAPLRLRATDSTRVTRSLLTLLTGGRPLRPGTGVAVNIPTDAFDRAARRTPDANPFTIADRMRDLGVPYREGTALARMCTGIQLAGQLGASVTREGRERPAPWAVGFHATEQGWFSRVRRSGTLTVNPTDSDRLLRQWQDLITATRAR